MDRFIDEQDASRDRSASPTTYHSLIFGDAKKGEQELLVCDIVESFVQTP